MANKNLRVNMQIETSIKANSAELKKLSDEIERYLSDFDFGESGSKQLREMKKAAQELQKILKPQKEGEVISEKAIKNLQDASSKMLNLVNKFNEFKSGFADKGINNFSKATIKEIEQIGKAIDKMKNDFHIMSGKDYDTEIKNIEKIKEKIVELNQELQQINSIDVTSQAKEKQSTLKTKVEQARKENELILQTREKMEKEASNIKNDYIKKTSKGVFSSEHDLEVFNKELAVLKLKKKQLEEIRIEMSKSSKEGNGIDDVYSKLDMSKVKGVAKEFEDLINMDIINKQDLSDFSKLEEELTKINNVLNSITDKAQIAKSLSAANIKENTNDIINSAKEEILRKDLPQYGSLSAMTRKENSNKREIEKSVNEINTTDFEKIAQEEIDVERRRVQEEIRINEERQKTFEDTYKKVIEQEQKVQEIFNKNKTGAENNDFDSSAIEQNNEALKRGIGIADNYASSIGKIFDKMSLFLSLNYLFDKFIQIIGQGINMTREMDKDMTQIGLVIGKTSSQVWNNFDQYNKMADKLNTTTTDVTKAMKLFYQQGLNTSQVNKMVEASAIAAALGETSMAEASETLTAIINSYNLTANEALEVTDKISAISIKSAADFHEMSEAIQKVASSASAAGLDLDHMMGYIAKMVETTREAPTNIGTSLKTIIANFEQFKSDPAFVTEEGVDVNKVDKALKSVGISLLASNGDMRDLGEVIDELGGKWEGLSRNQRSYLATMIAGTRQSSRFYALMNDYDRTLELVAEGQESSGSAQRQMLLYSQSLEAAQKKLTNQCEKFFNSLTKGNGVLVHTTNLLTGLLKIVNAAGPVATAVGGIVGAVKFGSIKEGLSSLAKDERKESFQNDAKIFYERLKENEEKNSISSFIPTTVKGKIINTKEVKTLSEEGLKERQKILDEQKKKFSGLSQYEKDYYKYYAQASNGNNLQYKWSNFESGAWNKVKSFGYRLVGKTNPNALQIDSKENQEKIAELQAKTADSTAKWKAGLAAAGSSLKAIAGAMLKAWLIAKAIEIAVGVISTLTNAMNGGAEAKKADEYAEKANTLKELKSRYAELASSTQRTVEEEKELLDIERQLINTDKKLAKTLEDENIGYTERISLIQEEIDSLEELEAMQRVESNNKNSRFKRSIFNLFGNTKDLVNVAAAKNWLGLGSIIDTSDIKSNGQTLVREQSSQIAKASGLNVKEAAILSQFTNSRIDDQSYDYINYERDLDKFSEEITNAANSIKNMSDASKDAYNTLRKNITSKDLNLYDINQSLLNEEHNIPRQLWLLLTKEFEARKNSLDDLALDYDIDNNILYQLSGNIIDKIFKLDSLELSSKQKEEIKKELINFIKNSVNAKNLNEASEKGQLDSFLNQQKINGALSVETANALMSVTNSATLAADALDKIAKMKEGYTALKDYVTKGMSQMEILDYVLQEVNDAEGNSTMPNLKYVTNNNGVLGIDYASILLKQINDSKNKFKLDLTGISASKTSELADAFAALRETEIDYLKNAFLNADATKMNSKDIDKLKTATLPTDDMGDIELRHSLWALASSAMDERGEQFYSEIEKIKQDENLDEDIKSRQIQDIKTKINELESGEGVSFIGITPENFLDYSDEVRQTMKNFQDQLKYEYDEELNAFRLINSDTGEKIGDKTAADEMSSFIKLYDAMKDSEDNYFSQLNNNGQAKNTTINQMKYPMYKLTTQDEDGSHWRPFGGLATITPDSGRFLSEEELNSIKKTIGEALGQSRVNADSFKNTDTTIQKANGEYYKLDDFVMHFNWEAFQNRDYDINNGTEVDKAFEQYLDANRGFQIQFNVLANKLLDLGKIQLGEDYDNKPEEERYVEAQRILAEKLDNNTIATLQDFQKELDLLDAYQNLVEKIDITATNLNGYAEAINVTANINQKAQTLNGYKDLTALAEKANAGNMSLWDLSSTIANNIEMFDQFAEVTNGFTDFSIENIDSIIQKDNERTANDLLNLALEADANAQICQEEIDALEEKGETELTVSAERLKANLSANDKLIKSAGDVGQTEVDVGKDAIQMADTYNKAVESMDEHWMALMDDMSTWGLAHAFEKIKTKDIIKATFNDIKSSIANASAKANEGNNPTTIEELQDLLLTGEEIASIQNLDNKQKLKALWEKRKKQYENTAAYYRALSQAALNKSSLPSADSKGGNSSSHSGNSSIDYLDKFALFVEKLEKIEKKMSRLSTVDEILNLSTNYYNTVLDQQLSLLEDKQQILNEYIIAQDEYLSELRNTLKSKYSQWIDFTEDGLVINLVDEINQDAAGYDEYNRLKNLYTSIYNENEENQQQLLDSTKEKIDLIKKSYENINNELTTMIEKLNLIRNKQNFKVDLDLGHGVNATAYSKLVKTYERELVAVEKTKSKLMIEEASLYAQITNPGYGKYLQYDALYNQFRTTEEFIRGVSNGNIDMTLAEKIEELAAKSEEIAKSKETVEENYQATMQGIKDTLNNIYNGFKEIIDEYAAMNSNIKDMLNYNLSTLDNDMTNYGVGVGDLEKRTKILKKSYEEAKGYEVQMNKLAENYFETFKKSYKDYIVTVNGNEVIDLVKIQESTTLNVGDREKLLNEASFINSILEESRKASSETQQALSEIRTNLVNIQNQVIEFKNTAVEALKGLDQLEIDNLRKKYDEMSTLDEEYYNELEKRISKQRDKRSAAQDQDNINQLQQRIALLQRNGGNGYSSELSGLRKQLQNALQEQADKDVDRELQRIKEEQEDRDKQREIEVSQLENLMAFKEENGIYLQEIQDSIEDGSQGMIDMYATYLSTQNLSREEIASKIDAFTNSINGGLNAAKKATYDTAGSIDEALEDVEDSITGKNSATFKIGQEIETTLDNYQSKVLTTINEISTELNRLSKLFNNEKIIEQMEQNSTAWYTTNSSTEKQNASNKNIELAKQYAELNGLTYYNYDGQTHANAIYNKNGQWIVTDAKGNEEALYTPDKWNLSQTNGLGYNNPTGIYDDTLGQSTEQIAQQEINSMGGKQAIKAGAEIYRARLEYASASSAEIAKNIAQDIYDLVDKNANGKFSSLGWYRADNGRWYSKDGIELSSEYLKKCYDLAIKYGYSNGGLVDYTGLAMVHGSSGSPEAFLNAKQTELFSQLRDSLVKNSTAFNFDTSNGTNNETIHIEGIEIAVKELAEIDDINKFINTVKQSIYKDATGTSALRLNRR